MNAVGYLVLTLLAIHLAMAIYVLIKLFKSTVFTKMQKKYNAILTISVPFIWSILIYYMLKKEPNSYELDRNKGGNHFHESGEGFLGGTGN